MTAADLVRCIRAMQFTPAHDNPVLHFEISLTAAVRLIEQHVEEAKPTTQILQYARPKKDTNFTRAILLCADGRSRSRP